MNLQSLKSAVEFNHQYFKDNSMQQYEKKLVILNIQNNHVEPF